MNDEDVSNSGKKRRQSIINYIKRNPGCNKQNVIKYCEEEGVGSRMPVRTSIDELIEEGILRIEKTKKNSRSYKLTVISENILVTIPQDLEEIYTQFKNFVDVVSEIIRDIDETFIKLKSSNYLSFGHTYSHQNILMSIPLLPYYVIDIINDVYNFYFVFILPKKIDKNDLYPKLYEIYFKTMTKMYSYVSKNIHKFSYTDKNGNIYAPDDKEYILTKRYTNFTTVGHISYLCMVLGIAKNLFSVLDLLWIKNIESVSELYESKMKDILSFKSFVSFMREKNKNYGSRLKEIYKHYKYNIIILNRIHEAIYYFMLETNHHELQKVTIKISDSDIDQKQPLWHKR